VTVCLGALDARGPRLVHTVRRRSAAVGDRLILAFVRDVTGVRSADVEVVTVHVGLAAWTHGHADSLEALPKGDVCRAWHIRRELEVLAIGGDVALGPFGIAGTARGDSGSHSDHQTDQNQPLQALCLHEPSLRH